MLANIAPRSTFELAALLFLKAYGGSFVIFAGLEECLRFAADYKFTPEDIAFLRRLLPGRTKESFFAEFLPTIDCSKIRIYATREGSVAFPLVPMMRIEGPVAIVQLLETTFLNIVNFASLVATNAARHRMAAGPGKMLVEFGLRRAQGPDGGMRASKYAYIGGYVVSHTVALLTVIFKLCLAFACSSSG